jgi:hypothetical protein
MSQNRDMGNPAGQRRARRMRDVQRIALARVFETLAGTGGVGRKIGRSSDGGVSGTRIGLGTRKSPWGLLPMCGVRGREAQG